MDSDIGGDVQGGEEAEEGELEGVSGNLSGKVETQTAVVAYAGGGAGVSTLSAQDEINICNVRNHFRGNVHAAHI